MYFRGDDGQLRRVPASWTSEGDSDAFKVIAAGRCHFRPEDLLRLADLIEQLGVRRSVR